MWRIDILNFTGGFSPNWWRETYSSFGNKNMASSMQNCDLTNPNSVTQGPGLVTLTAGTQAAAVTTLIKGMLKAPTSADLSFGVGLNKLYSFSNTAVTNAGNFPHTIDKATVTGEDGEDVAYYQGKLYYSYNHSASGGDVGMYDMSSTFDDDWASTVPAGAHALSNNPHQLLVAGNDTLYIANGRYLSSYDGATFVEQDLDLPVGSVITSIAWAQNRIWVAANRPNLTGTNNNTSSIYSYDGTSTSWDDELLVGGLVSALFVKNGVVFVFYADITSTGGFKLGYLNGTAVVDLTNFTGALPYYYQVSEYQDYIIWNSNGLIYAWGSGGKDLTTKTFQLADGGFSTIGGISCPFGTPVIASNETTSYKLAKFSGYDVNSNWKSLMFDITNSGTLPRIEGVRINFETMATGASVLLTLRDGKGNSLFTNTISATSEGTGISKFIPLNAGTNNFRCELDWATGSSTNPCKIKSIKFNGSN